MWFGLTPHIRCARCAWLCGLPHESAVRTWLRECFLLATRNRQCLFASSRHRQSLSTLPSLRHARDWCAAAGHTPTRFTWERFLRMFFLSTRVAFQPSPRASLLCACLADVSPQYAAPLPSCCKVLRVRKWASGGADGVLNNILKKSIRSAGAT